MNELKLRDISKTFSGNPVLNRVSLEIREGELFFLLGPSGCGKTTLLRIIAGLENADSGSVSFGGQDFSRIPVEKRNLGMVFQNYSLWPHMTVLENVTYGLALRRVPEVEARTMAEDALAKVGLGGYGPRKPGTLSGGEQQRAALARAIVTKPLLLLLDEPLSNLDAALRVEMRGEIRRLHRSLGITMIFVTHDQEEAAALADRMAVMRKGRVEQVGTPADIYRDPANAFVGGFFGESNLIPGSLSSLSTGTARLQCNGTALEASIPAGISSEQGQDATLLIRPHHIHRAEADDRENRFEGTVRSVEFFGPVRKYTAETPIGLIRFQEPESISPLAEGERVALCFRKENARVLKP